MSTTGGARGQPAADTCPISWRNHETHGPVSRELHIQDMNRGVKNFPAWLSTLKLFKNRTSVT